MSDTVTAAALKWHLSGFRYDLTDEESIQRGIASSLGVGGFAFQREPRLSAKDRPDFLVAGKVVIEVKRHGVMNALLRQLSRYAEHDEVHELLVVTARVQSSDLPPSLNGKPIECLVLLGSIFG